MSDLKQCPFCGADARMITGRVAEDAMFAMVECNDCGASTEEFEDAYAPLEQATAAWNRRPSNVGSSA